MPIAAFDVDSSNKAGFNFRIAYAQGYRVALIKFGGMNISGNRPYRMNGYQAFVDAAFDAGFKIVGDYIVTGGSDPVGAARFWLANRDPRITFHVLDNEVLDSGNIYTDGEASVYFDTIGPVVNRWQYGSRDSLWNARSWPGLAARGIKAHVAIYNDSPLSNCYPRTYPAGLVKAHQFTSSADIGGLLAVDANAFTDDAFAGPQIERTNDEDEMKPIYSWYVDDDGSRVWFERVPGTGAWAEWRGDVPWDGIATGFVQQFSPALSGNQVTKSVRDMLYANAMALRPVVAGVSA